MQFVIVMDFSCSNLLSYHVSYFYFFQWNPFLVYFLGLYSASHIIWAVGVEEMLRIFPLSQLIFSYEQPIEVGKLFCKACSATLISLWCDREHWLSHTSIVFVYYVYPSTQLLQHSLDSPHGIFVSVSIKLLRCL